MPIETYAEIERYLDLGMNALQISKRLGIQYRTAHARVLDIRNQQRRACET